MSAFVPSMGLKDVVWHMESLECTLKALNDSPVSPYLMLNLQMLQAVLQNQMALDT